MKVDAPKQTSDIVGNEISNSTEIDTASTLDQSASMPEASTQERELLAQTITHRVPYSVEGFYEESQIKTWGHPTHYERNEARKAPADIHTEYTKLKEVHRTWLEDHDLLPFKDDTFAFFEIPPGGDPDHLLIVTEPRLDSRLITTGDGKSYVVLNIGSFGNRGGQLDKDNQGVYLSNKAINLVDLSKIK